MKLIATIVVLAALAVPSACSSLTRDALNATSVSSAKPTTLAFAADPAFGAGLSRREWRRLARAELRALDFVQGGKAQSWGQPNARARGRVEVSQPFSIASRECRRFRHVVTLRAREQAVTGVACRTDKGPWSLVS